MSKFGHTLRAYRDSKGLSQTELAKAVGVHPSAVSKWERGTTAYPNGPIRKLLADALGVPLSDFEADAGIPTLRSKAKAPPGIPVINRAEAGVATNYVNDQYEGGEYHGAWEYIDRGDIDDPLAYAVEVAELSMAPTLMPGDRLVLRPVTGDAGSPELGDGALVFVRLTGDAPGDLSEHCTIARWRELDADRVMLSKDNPSHPPIVVRLEHVARVARAAEIRRKL